MPKLTNVQIIHVPVLWHYLMMFSVRIGLNSDADTHQHFMHAFVQIEV